MKQIRDVFYKEKYRTLSLFECQVEVITRREESGAWVEGGATVLMKGCRSNFEAL